MTKDGDFRIGKWWLVDVKDKVAQRVRVDQGGTVYVDARFVLIESDTARNAIINAITARRDYYI